MTLQCYDGFDIELHVNESTHALVAEIMAIVNFIVNTKKLDSTT